MFEGVDWSQVVACAPRPEGSWIHLLGLVAFVAAARWLAPASHETVSGGSSADSAPGSSGRGLA